MLSTGDSVYGPSTLVESCPMSCDEPCRKSASSRKASTRTSMSECPLIATADGHSLGGLIAAEGHTVGGMPSMPEIGGGTNTETQSLAHERPCRRDFPILSLNREKEGGETIPDNMKITILSKGAPPYVTTPASGTPTASAVLISL